MSRDEIVGAATPLLHLPLPLGLIRAKPEQTRRGID